MSQQVPAGSTGHDVHPDGDGSGRRNAHEVVFTVTELTKVINGVRTQVLWDRDFEEGALLEEELAFWAQDDFGNVWLLGSTPRSTRATRSRRPDVAGRESRGSTAGILMRANPKLEHLAVQAG